MRRQLGPRIGHAMIPSMSLSPIARRGLLAMFSSTFFELCGVFMMQPLNLLRLKAAGVDTAWVGLFAATVWLAIFFITPFVTHITTALGRRHALWLSAWIPVFSGLVYAISDAIWAWVLAAAISGLAGGLRWILAEALIAEFAPAQRRGAMVGWFETMVGLTFVLGPVLLSLTGPASPHAVWVAWGLLLCGSLISLAIPPLHHDDHATTARGWRGIWRAFRAAPVVMLAGFTGGFFEAGLSSMLPLYGLALGLGAAAAALMVSASGLGSSVAMWPMGWLSDRLARRHHAHARGAALARWQLLRVCALVTLLATLCLPLVAHAPALAWALCLAWGAAGGSLYTLAMIDIGSQHRGVALENATAVLVLSYTVGGMLAPSLGAAALQASPRWGFAALLASVAALASWALWRWGAPAPTPLEAPIEPHDHPTP